MCNFRRFHNKTFLRFDMSHLHNAVIDSELKKRGLAVLDRPIPTTYIFNSPLQLGPEPPLAVPKSKKISWWFLRFHAIFSILKLSASVIFFPSQNLLVLLPTPWSSSLSSESSYASSMCRATFEKSLLIGPWLRSSHHIWSQLKSWFNKWGITPHKIVNSQLISGSQSRLAMHS